MHTKTNWEKRKKERKRKQKKKGKKGRNWHNIDPHVAHLHQHQFLVTTPSAWVGWALNTNNLSTQCLIPIPQPYQNRQRNEFMHSCPWDWLRHCRLDQVGMGTGGPAFIQHTCLPPNNVCTCLGLSRVIIDRAGVAVIPLLVLGQLAAVGGGRLAPSSVPLTFPRLFAPPRGHRHTHVAALAGTSRPGAGNTAGPGAAPEPLSGTALVLVRHRLGLDDFVPATNVLVHGPPGLHGDPLNWSSRLS